MNFVIFNFISSLPNRPLRSVPISKVLTKIVMFDMKQFVILHLKNKCWRSSWILDSLQRWHFPYL